MSEHEKENDQEIKPNEKSNNKEITLADYAAKKLRIKKGKLPEDWCRVIIKR